MKPRSSSSFRRKIATRKIKEFVLIVCEGEKTEPSYLDALIKDRGLTATRVEVTGDCGSAPISVVDEALKLFSENGEYDRVYCVFDKDQHTTFNAALTKIGTTKLKRRKGIGGNQYAAFEAIASVPCFEYWLLSHYEYTTAHFATFSDVEKKMSAHPTLAKYYKGKRDIYAVTKERLQIAISNVERANSAAESSGTDNPTSGMNKLVAYLLSAK